MRLIFKVLSVAVVLSSSVLLAEPSAFQQAWALANQAREAARSGAPEKSMETYRRALELAPDSMAIRRDYATALGWAGRYNEAGLEFEKVVALDPKQPIWAVQEMANAHFFAENNPAALALFDQLIAAGHQAEAILTRRGLTLLRLGRLEDAENQYRQALAAYSESPAAAVGIVRSMAEQGRPDDAYAVAVTWGADAPADAEIRVWTARLLAVLGRYEEAIAAYDRLAPAKLKDPEVARWRDLAIQFLRPGHLVNDSGTLPDTPAASDSTLAQLVASADDGTGLPRASDALPDDATWLGRSLREAGVRLARQGQLDSGLSYLEYALKLEPQHAETRRDYAIVLNWAERYSDAIQQFAIIIERDPDQPAWALSELAQAQLFGGAPKAALATLEALIEKGEVDMSTRSRHGLALRWLGRSEEAASVYRRIIKDFPNSPEGSNGLVQALADRNRLTDALDAAERGLERFPADWHLRAAQAQVLNWAGRHVRADKTLQRIPSAFLETSDVLHHRSLAARWASRPREAFELAVRYRDRHPSDPQADRLLRDLGYEYGSSFRAEAEAVSDSAGYSYRGVSERLELPLSPGSRVRFSHNFRRFEDRATSPRPLTWNRYAVGWSGAMGHRVTADVSASEINYGLVGRRLVAEASASALLTDRVAISAGAGVFPGETLEALGERVTARQLWTAVELRPNLKIDAEARYSRQVYEGSTTRQVMAFSAFRTVSRRGGHKIRVGARSQWMWHDRPSRFIWSPRRAYTQLGSLRMEGRLPGGVDYVAEAGVGVQRESGEGRQVPLVTTLEFAKRIQPRLWLQFKTGYSNSSLDRISPGATSYQFRYMSFGLDFRFNRWG